MKAFIRNTVVAVTICAFASIAALAGDKDKISKSITFVSDTTVNGTVVKAGQYDLKFDQQTNELLIEKNGKVVAKAAAEYKPRENKARTTLVRTVNRDNAAEFVGVTFGGSQQDIVLTGSNSQVTGN